MARYEAGETLSSIARTYDCSPPAISYVVSRSRARGPVATPHFALASAEPQLVKSSPVNGGAAANGSAPAPAPGSAATLSSEATANGAAQPKSVSDNFADPRGDTSARPINGFAGNGSAVTNSAGAAAPAPQPIPPATVAFPASGHSNGDQRLKLHLSLGNASQVGSAAPQTESHPAERQHQAPYQRQPGHNDRPGPLPAATAAAALFEPAHRAAPLTPPRQEIHAGAPKEGNGSFIDHELRARVDGDIAAFLAAFDAALVQDTQESRSALREATDRLLRAGARTRIELERLEARMPLARRDAAHAEPAWRPRQ